MAATDVREADERTRAAKQEAWVDLAHTGLAARRRTTPLILEA